MSPHQPPAYRGYRPRHAVRRPRWHSAYTVTACLAARLLLILSVVVAALTWLSPDVLGGVSQAAAGQGVPAAAVLARLEDAYLALLALAARQRFRPARRPGRYTAR